MTPADSRYVLTLGETMALLDPTSEGPIAPGMAFRLRVAGAESNFGIALSRLGMPVRWVSRLGRDPLGEVVFETLEREGLDLSFVHRDPAPTGLFFKWRTHTRSHVLYYRSGSAASKLEPADVPDAALEGVGLIHVSGITMALSDSARRTVVDVARRARERNITVTFDPNYRPALWTSPEEAASVHREVLPFTDWYLCGQEEGGLLWAAQDSESLLASLAAAGVERTVVRLGAEAALVRDGSNLHAVAPGRLEEVADEIGAGDGFAAGFAYGLLHGWRPQACAAAGHLIAARAVLGTGDWETFPRLPEVSDALEAISATAAATSGTAES